MTDDRLLTSARRPEDVDEALRPKTLDDFVGQKAARENLRVGLRFACLLASMVCTTPAAACMIDPLPEFFLLDALPSAVPTGATVLKVAISKRPTPDWILTAGWPGRARVVGRNSQLGANIRIAPIGASSCTGYGRLNRPAYVVGVLERRPGNEPVLRAFIYKRPWWADLLRLVGMEAWLPGPRARS